MSVPDPSLLQIADERARELLKTAQGALLRAAQSIAKECNIPDQISGLSAAELLGRMCYSPTMRKDLHRIALAYISQKYLKELLPESKLEPDAQADPGTERVGLTWDDFTKELGGIGFTVPSDILKQWDVRTRQTIMEYVQRWQLAPEDKKPPAPSSLLPYRATPTALPPVPPAAVQPSPVNVGRDMEPLANFADIEPQTAAALRKLKIVTAADYLGQPAGAKLPGIGPARTREIAQALAARGYV